MRPPDGYTLLLVGPSHAVNATLYPKLNYNFIRDIAPIASISREPLVMVVNPSVPAKTVAEFIACQSQFGQAQYGVVRHWNLGPCRRRAVQDDDRHQHAARALSRRGACDYRPYRRASAGDVRHAAILNRVHQGR